MYSFFFLWGGSSGTASIYDFVNMQLAQHGQMTLGAKMPEIKDFQVRKRTTFFWMTPGAPSRRPCPRYWYPLPDNAPTREPYIISPSVLRTGGTPVYILSVLEGPAAILEIM
jgi:hypothetical protein